MSSRLASAPRSGTGRADPARLGKIKQPDLVAVVAGDRRASSITGAPAAITAVRSVPTLTQVPDDSLKFSAVRPSEQQARPPDRPDRQGARRRRS